MSVIKFLLFLKSISLFGILAFLCYLLWQSKQNPKFLAELAEDIKNPARTLTYAVKLTRYLGLFIIYCSLLAGSYQIHLLIQGRRTTATIIETPSQWLDHGTRRPNVYPVFEFFHDNMLVRARTTVQGWAGEKGQQVIVIYDPSEPQLVMADREQWNWIGWGFGCFVGLGFVFFSFLISARGSLSDPAQ